MRGQQTRALLRLLLDNGIDHVVVGGVAAIAWGASELTRDLDIVIPYRAEDIAELLAALAPHHPKHATRPDLGVIRDAPDRLATFRMLLIETDLKVGAIALQSGFCDYRHMALAFRRELGASPSAYRQGGRTLKAVGGRER